MYLEGDTSQSERLEISLGSFHGTQNKTFFAGTDVVLPVAMEGTHAGWMTGEIRWLVLRVFMMHHYITNPFIIPKDIYDIDRWFHPTEITNHFQIGEYNPRYQENIRNMPHKKGITALLMSSRLIRAESNSWQPKATLEYLLHKVQWRKTNPLIHFDIWKLRLC